MRLQVVDHTIIESKPEAIITDLRLSEPFETLKEYVNGFKTLSEMENIEHCHVPYVVLLMILMSEWKEKHNGHLPA